MYRLLYLREMFSHLPFFIYYFNRTSIFCSIILIITIIMKIGDGHEDFSS